MICAGGGNPSVTAAPRQLPLHKQAGVRWSSGLSSAYFICGQDSPASLVHREVGRQRQPGGIACPENMCEAGKRHRQEKKPLQSNPILQWLKILIKLRRGYEISPYFDWVWQRIRTAWWICAAPVHRAAAFCAPHLRRRRCAGSADRRR